MRACPLDKNIFYLTDAMVVWGMCAQPHAVNRRSNITSPGKQAIEHHLTR
ncbi:hypothetical protein [Scytonema hofmannii]|nr:hypothetical protein [Scytonema hofmannii]